ncbi:hypothetical protein FB451DRAFT_1310698 [Mycena latifolia]|nr:hypothetical protein FB451DRAFT_1310698 [Mycena latifolia]
MLNHLENERSESATNFNDSEDVASAKLWAVYIAEADKYDKALVEGWRSDMGGMLIFAGLFSASLTAFIIESYKTLNPDSGQTTVILLAQISQQLAAAANGSVLEAPVAPPFVPSTAALVCNALWFASLGLSLSCALIATLLEQWARDFLHKADMRSAPLIRARILSYLYYGLKRFNMHTVVELIPLLLHASLLLFFAGLVAFLLDVNTPIMIVAAAFLLLFAGVYSIITILPLRYLECPYRTPLSNTIWLFLHNTKQLWARWRSSRETPISEKPEALLSQPVTAIGAMARQAMESSEERSARDYRALVWTVKSLTDNVELEPFVEGIPDILWSPKGRRHSYDDCIRGLIHHPDVKLSFRIETLLRSCESGLLSAEAHRRRQTACCKALWAIGTLSTSNPTKAPDHRTSLQDFTGAYIHMCNGQFADIDHYSTSAKAVLRWSTFCSVNHRLAELLEYLARCEADLRRHQSLSLEPIISYLAKLGSSPAFWFPVYDVEINTYSPALLIEKFVRDIQEFRTITPYTIFFDYLRESAELKSLPYQFESTCVTIQPRSPVYSFAPPCNVEPDINAFVETHSMGSNTIASDTLHWIDEILGLFISTWHMNRSGEPCVPRGLIQYMTCRKSDSAVEHVVGKFGVSDLWAGITSLLTRGCTPASRGFLASSCISLDDTLIALWRTCTLNLRDPPHSKLSIYESALEAVVNSGSSSILPSVIAVLKHKIAHTLAVSHRRYPATHATSDSESDNLHLLPDRIGDAKINILAEFLEACKSTDLPYNAGNTISFVSGGPPLTAIGSQYQIRLANSINHLWGTPSHSGVMEALLHSDIFQVYACSTDDPAENMCPWIDDPVAHKVIKEFMVECATALSSEPLSGSLVTRVQAILHGMEMLHPVSGTRVRSSTTE